MATLCVICGKALLCKRTVFVKLGLDSLIKAREIVASADKNSQVSKIIVRHVHGFHMCMSFLGLIGWK